MNPPRKLWIAAGLLLAAGAVPSAQAQSSVAFAPSIGVIPDGVTLGVTPVVSADRRYVRMTLDPQFIGNVEFTTFSVPAGVRGGGIGGFGGGGGGAGGLGGGGLGAGGGVGGGFGSVGVIGQGGAFDPLAQNLAPVPQFNGPTEEMLPAPRSGKVTSRIKAKKSPKKPRR